MSEDARRADHDRCRSLAEGTLMDCFADATFECDESGRLMPIEVTRIQSELDGCRTDAHRAVLDEEHDFLRTRELRLIVVPR